jgi:hypothetical protein
MPHRGGEMKTILLYAGAWLGLVALAIVNGALREKTYGPHMEELSAHQLSTVIGLCLFAAYIWFLTGLCRLETARQALLIGAMWLIMTVAFEFLFGHYVAGHSWSRLLHDYNLLKGRVWVLVLIWTAVAPYFFYRVRS